MSFFLNECSLHNQFHTIEEFFDSFNKIWGCKEVLRSHLFELSCGNTALAERIVMNGENFRKVVGNLQDRNLQRIIRRWIDQEGPFWDDENNRIHSSDEYFTCGEEVVTDTSLAEAAYMKTNGYYAATISFTPSNYMINPTNIRWAKTTSDVIDITVDNFWEIDDLERIITGIAPSPRSWDQMVERARTEFPNLVFLDSFGNGLHGQAFSPTIAGHALYLLRLLNELKQCFNEVGERTPRGHQIYQEYFIGDNAKFSDESERNKERFRNDLTFHDPSGNDIFCPYHGKISHRIYRLHFSWPITRNDNLYIAYLGPKITKD